MSCIAIALVPAVLCATLSRPILGIVYTQLEPDVMDNAVRYFLISALSYPFLAMQQAAAALFRAAGESKTPMKVTLVANVINIAGNALLIYGVHLGVTGAALATLFSRMVSGLTLLVFLRQPTHKLQVTNYRKLRPTWRIIKMILRIGVPTDWKTACSSSVSSSSPARFRPWARQRFPPTPWCSWWRAFTAIPPRPSTSA